MSNMDALRKRKKCLDYDNLDNVSKQELVDKVKQQEAHILQLQNIVAKIPKRGALASVEYTKKPRKNKPFDFSKWNTRHVALKILYLGWDYNGFAHSEDTSNTIEAQLFTALLQTKLIESREGSCYQRCGRTDKGVSALCQVISIELRTNLLEGLGVKVRKNGSAGERAGDKTSELPYVKMVNASLPHEIRVIAWTPVDDEFSARFSCQRRTYKYFITMGQLDVEVMREAAQKLVGSHDFRNFCKMDVANGITKFIRSISQISIEAINNDSDGYQLCEFTVVGNAFLWHQIRCIVAILVLIGGGKERPDVIDDLLNVGQNPRKPQYAMASELPLVLFSCDYTDLEWVYDEQHLIQNISLLQTLWSVQAIKTTIVRKMLDEISTSFKKFESEGSEEKSPVKNQECAILTDFKRKKHIPLFKRQLCPSLENRIEHYARKQRLDCKSKKNVSYESTSCTPVVKKQRYALSDAPACVTTDYS